MVVIKKKKRKQKPENSIRKDVETLESVHCWWLCKLEQPLWKTEFLDTPAIPFLAMYSKELQAGA
jgi:hypothetical protein